MSNDVVRYVVRDNDVAMCKYHGITMHNDIDMGGHCGVMLIDLHLPDWSISSEHIPTYQIKQAIVLDLPCSCPQ